MVEKVTIERVPHSGRGMTLKISADVDGNCCEPSIVTVNPERMVKTACPLKNAQKLAERCKALDAMLRAGNDTRTDAEKLKDEVLFASLDDEPTAADLEAAIETYVEYHKANALKRARAAAAVNACGCKGGLLERLGVASESGTDALQLESKEGAS